MCALFFASIFLGWRDDFLSLFFLVVGEMRVVNWLIWIRQGAKIIETEIFDNAMKGIGS